jgi:hypothetical protein
LRTTSSTPLSKSARVVYREGVSLTAITGELALADQECLDRIDVRIGSGIHPLAEFTGIEPRRGHALATKKRSIAVFNELALINHYDHSSASESVWCFVQAVVRIGRITGN